MRPTSIPRYTDVGAMVDSTWTIQSLRPFPPKTIGVIDFGDGTKLVLLSPEIAGLAAVGDIISPDGKSLQKNA